MFFNVFNVGAQKHQTHSLSNLQKNCHKKAQKLKRKKREVLFTLCSVLQTKSLGPLLVVVRTYAALQTQWLLNKSYTSTTNTLLIDITIGILNGFINNINVISSFQPLTGSSCSHSLKEAKGRHWKRYLIFHVCNFHT